MSKSITEQGFAAAAKELGVEVATIKAVASVESAGSGFDPDGRVKILFERHKFHTFTRGQFDKSHPAISSSSAGGYGAAGAHQWKRFNEAFELDPDAAMRATSWGKFQIMGFNCEAAGYSSVGEFVEAMKVDEDTQLKAFVKVIKSWGLAGELRQHDWAGFARQYNGSQFRKNQYDTKLAAAYERFKRERAVIPSSPVATDIVNPSPTAPTADDGVQSSTPASGAVKEPDAKEVKMSAMSSTSKRLTFSMIGSAILLALKEAWTTAREETVDAGKYAIEHLPQVLLILGLATLGVIVYNAAMKRKDMRTNKIIDIAADKDKNDVVIT